jgi:penicillin-binding protein 2
MNLVNADIIEEPLSRNNSVKRRFSALQIILACILLIAISRGAYLQIIQGSSFRSKAEHNRVDSVIIPAPRGIIYDRNHTQLVENVSSTDLVFKPKQLPKISLENNLLDALKTLLPDLDIDQTKTALTRSRKTGQETLIAKALDHDTVLKLEQHKNDIVGTALESSLVRKYSFAESFGHILGYTSPVSADQLAKNPSLTATDTTGKQGIEQQYDTALRGEHGLTYTEVNASGKQQTDLGQKPAIAGQDLTLTIDAELQKFTYGLFSDLASKNQQSGGEPVRELLL